MTAAASGSQEFHDRLESLARRHFGDTARIAELKALTGGASAETWRFDVNTSQARIALILQRSAGTQQFEASLDRAIQGRVQAAAYDGGVPVARVRLICDELDNLGDGYVMDRIEGETLGPRILKQAEFAGARAGMTQQCGEILARIHGIGTHTLPPLPVRAARDSLDSMCAIYRRCGVELPVFELALQWLEDHLPAPHSMALVHGDFRLGNLMVGPEGIRAVLDWEMAHIGDPIEDFGWICVPSWRFGQLDNEVGGFGQLRELIACYESAGGQGVDCKRIEFWQVLGCLKWGLICLFFAFQYLNGDVRAIERAVIGRRTSETELDLLTLMRGD
jgi:aminoglycoside phosphotransferase (APT) family kinase protein